MKKSKTPDPDFTEPFEEVPDEVVPPRVVPQDERPVQPPLTPQPEKRKGRKPLEGDQQLMRVLIFVSHSDLMKLKSYNEPLSTLGRRIIKEWLARN